MNLFDIVNKKGLTDLFATLRFVRSSCCLAKINVVVSYEKLRLYRFVEHYVPAGIADVLNKTWALVI